MIFFSPLDAMIYCWRKGNMGWKFDLILSIKKREKCRKKTTHDVLKQRVRLPRKPFLLDACIRDSIFYHFKRKVNHESRPESLFQPAVLRLVMRFRLKRSATNTQRGFTLTYPLSRSMSIALIVNRKSSFFLHYSSFIHRKTQQEGVLHTRRNI